MRRTRLLNGFRGAVLIVIGLLLATGSGRVPATSTPAVTAADRITGWRAGSAVVEPHAATWAPAAAATRARVSEAYRKLPVHFETNRGQTDARVKFLARGGGYTLFLTATEAVLAFADPTPQSLDEGPRLITEGPGLEGQLHRRQMTGTALRMTVVGGNPAARVAGQKDLPGKANYFLGDDPRNWRSQVPTYARVHYREIYPGIDLMYYGTRHRLEYDFIVAPGADPGRIELGFEGADRLEMDAAGDLVLETAAGAIRQGKPVIYQEVAGGRREIAGGYVLNGANTVGFQVAAYDVSRPLVIDPVLAYSTYLGGSGFERGNGIAVDEAGNAYVTGATGSVDFPTTPGAFRRFFSRGESDAFVTKLDSTGTVLLYSTYLGSFNPDEGTGIAVDADGSAYVTGATGSGGAFPTTPGAFQRSTGGFVNAFVTKLDPTGSALVYSTLLGGSRSDNGRGIAVDGTGSAYVTGSAGSFNFPTTPGAFDRTFDGEAFVTKLDPTGSTLVYSTFLGGSGIDGGRAIAVDGAGNAYVTGRTCAADFPTTLTAFQPVFGGGAANNPFGCPSDAFVTKLDAAGSSLVYSTYLGGSGNEDGAGIAVDDADHAYVTGWTDSANFPSTLEALQLASGGLFDAFMTKVDPTGSSLVYSTYLGGSGHDFSLGIAVDRAGNAYVTGDTGSPDFPTTPAAFQPAFGGGTATLFGCPCDAFVTKVDPTSSTLVYSTYLGGSGDDFGRGIAVRGAGNAYLTGQAGSADFPTTSEALSTALSGITDAYVAKILLHDAPANQPRSQQVGVLRLWP